MDRTTALFDLASQEGEGVNRGSYPLSSSVYAALLNDWVANFPSVSLELSPPRPSWAIRDFKSNLSTSNHETSSPTSDNGTRSSRPIRDFKSSLSTSSQETSSPTSNYGTISSWPIRNSLSRLSTSNLAAGSPTSNYGTRSSWPIRDSRPSLSTFNSTISSPIIDSTERPRWPTTDLSSGPNWPLSTNSLASSSLSLSNSTTSSPTSDNATRSRWPTTDLACRSSWPLPTKSPESSSLFGSDLAIDIVLAENEIIPTASVDEALAEFRATGRDTPYQVPLHLPSVSIQQPERSSQKKTSTRHRKKLHCVFCDTNGEEHVDHAFKDSSGRVVCPVLSAYTCKLCGASGDLAHTFKYCPKNPFTRGNPVARGLPPGIPLSLAKDGKQ